MAISPKIDENGPEPLPSPAILAAAMAKDWPSAMRRMVWFVDPKMHAAIMDIACDDRGWLIRQVMAWNFSRELIDTNRAAADAMLLLATPTRDKVMCAEIARKLDQAQAPAHILNGWEAMAEGFETSFSDIICAAHDASERADRAPLMSIDDMEKEPERGVVVIEKFGGIDTAASREAKAAFKAIIGRKVPLYPVPDLAAVKKKLLGEFPHAQNLINVLLSDLAERAAIKLRCSLLIGPPGCGKSRFVRKVGEALGAFVGRFDGAGAGDAAFGGTGRRWSTAEPCWPLSVISSCGHANPLILVDEIDKAGTSRHNGNLFDSILTTIEPETAARFADPLVQGPVDISYVSFLLTANDDTGLSSPLKDRCRILRMPAVKSEHVPAIAKGLIADLAAERGIDAQWYELDGDELEIAARMLGDGSIRRLRSVIERLLMRRDESPTLRN